MPGSVIVYNPPAHQCMCLCDKDKVRETNVCVCLLVDICPCMVLHLNIPPPTKKQRVDFSVCLSCAGDGKGWIWE